MPWSSPPDFVFCFFIFLILSLFHSFSFCFLLFIQLQSATVFAIEWGWRRIAASHWLKPTKHYQPPPHRSCFSFYCPQFFYQEIKFRAAGMDSTTTKNQQTKQWHPTFSDNAFPLTHQAKHREEMRGRAGEGICDVSGSVWERPVLGCWSLLGMCVCRVMAAGRAIERRSLDEQTFDKKTIPLFFPSHTSTFFFFMCFHNHSYLWNGVSVSTCRNTSIYCLPSFQCLFQLYPLTQTHIFSYL